MELVMVSGIQLLALMVIGAVDYLTNIGAKTAVHYAREVPSPLPHTTARQRRPQPDTLEQFDRAA
jgi:hypothetical protein